MLDYTSRQQSQDLETRGQATADMILYRAYSRPYNVGGARVLHLFASGEYSLAPVRIFFRPVPWQSNTFALAERVPNSVCIVRNYVSTSYSSGYGTTDLPEAVVIIDAHGEHIVCVEPLGGTGGVRTAVPQEPSPGYRRIAQATGSAAVRRLPAPSRGGGASAVRAVIDRPRSRALPGPECRR